MPVTLVLPEDTEPDGRLLSYCLERYRGEFQRLQRLARYYDNQNDITRRWFEDPSLPNNRISHAFASYISCMATSYFMGIGMKYETEDEECRRLLDEVYLENTSDSLNFEEAKEMSVSGVSYELLTVGEDGRLHCGFFKAREIIPIYGGSGSFLTMAVRLYEENHTDGSQEMFAEIYTKTEILLFQGGAGGWREVRRVPHYFGDVPVIVRRNNSERKGDFENVIPQIDAYDRAQSDTLNDLDFFTDAYLVIQGAEEIVEEAPGKDGGITQRPGKVMRQNRTLYLPDGGGVSFLTKDTESAAAESFKKRIYQDIFFLSQVPNLTDESFSGSLSGVAQKYRLLGLQGLADEKEKYWKSAERKKLKLALRFLNTLHGTAFDWREVKIRFDRSQIANTLEISQMMANLRGILSDETVIGMWPEVENAGRELEKRLKEEAQRENSGPVPDGEIY